MRKSLSLQRFIILIILILSLTACSSKKELETYEVPNTYNSNIIAHLPIGYSLQKEEVELGLFKDETKIGSITLTNFMMGVTSMELLKSVPEIKTLADKDNKYLFRLTTETDTLHAIYFIDKSYAVSVFVYEYDKEYESMLKDMYFEVVK